MEKWGLFPEQLLFADPYSSHFSCFNVGPSKGLHSIRNIYSHVSSPEDAVLQEISIWKYPSVPQWSSTSCKVLLKHLKDFLPSSLFDHDVTRLFITLFPSLLIPTNCFPFLKIYFPRGTTSMAERLSCAMHESIGGTWNCLCPSQHSHSLSSQTALHSLYGQGLGTCTKDNLEFPELVMSSTANTDRVI